MKRCAKVIIAMMTFKCKIIYFRCILYVFFVSSVHNHIGKSINKSDLAVTIQTFDFGFSGLSRRSDSQPICHLGKIIIIN